MIDGVCRCVWSDCPCVKREGMWRWRASTLAELVVVFWPF